MRPLFTNKELSRVSVFITVMDCLWLYKFKMEKTMKKNKNKNKKSLYVISLILMCFTNSVYAMHGFFGGFMQHINPASDSDYYENGAPDPAKIELGKSLFFDKLLSGNQNISCASCHHSLTDTGDGLSLPVGEGGKGLGVTRDTGVDSDAIHERVPRNAPPVFNLGARQFSVMFHDGRVSLDSSQPSGFITPAADQFPMGLDNALAAQAMFPVTSSTEMAGQAGENSIADSAASGKLAGVGGVWDQLALRLQNNTNYVAAFKTVFSDINKASDISYIHAANAIAAFEAAAWRTDNSPFDRYLKGDTNALSSAQKIGMDIFYGKANCVSCHGGLYQTDHQFHAIAMPQIGPGKGDGHDGHEDFGRERVTGNINDRYKFRTPTLRNVSLTGPWGHAGAYNTLEAIVQHHLDPINSLFNYDQSQAMLPSRTDLDVIDFIVQNDPIRLQTIAAANELTVTILSVSEIRYLIDFLHALTDPEALDLRSDTPKRVLSGDSLAD